MTYYKLTERELLALVATAESCLAMSEGTADEGLHQEATEAMEAIKRIEKRHGVSIQSDFSEQNASAVEHLEWDS